MRISAVTEALNAAVRKTDGIKKAEQAAKTRSSHTDRSELSAHGQRLSKTKAEKTAVETQVALQPDVRPEKVAEVRRKIQEGYYNSEEFTDKLAEKLLKEFGMGGETA